jgi:hypothetical protein
MKKNQVIVIDSVNSPYFESAMLIVKENVVCEDDKLLNEANAIVNKFAQKCGYNLSSAGKGSKPSFHVCTSVCSIIFGIICMAIAILT